ncbi:MAG: thioesterase family protein [Alphaproteobacteria bacterium]
MDIPTPLELHRAAVLPEWIDYNGHMNVAYYVLAFDHATDAFLDYIGLDAAHKARHACSTFVVDMNVTYRREVVEGDALLFRTRLLDFDSKRMLTYHEMHHAASGYLAATNEILQVHVDMETRRVSPIAPSVLGRLEALHQAHRTLPPPDNAGRVIRLRRTSGSG